MRAPANVNQGMGSQTWLRGADVLLTVRLDTTPNRNGETVAPVRGDEGVANPQNPGELSRGVATPLDTRVSAEPSPVAPPRNREHEPK